MVFEREREEEYLWPEALLRLLEKASSLVPVPEIEGKKPEVRDVPPARLEGQLICGVDGSHAGKELSGHYFGIAVAMAYTSDWRVIRDERPIFDGDIYRLTSVAGQTWLSLEETGYIFTVAKKAVEQRRPNWIIIDGPLLMYPGLIYHDDPDGVDLDRLRGYRLALHDCAGKILNFLQACKERGVGTLGLVKRVRSSLFDPTKRRRDASFLQKHMRYGQMTKPVQPGKHPSLNLYEKVSQELGFKPEVPWKDYFTVVYLKSSRVKPPFRLELPHWVHPEEAASMVLAVSDPITGVPVHIQRVEGLIRIGQETLRSVYARLLTKMRGSPDLIPLHGEEFVGQRWERA